MNRRWARYIGPYRCRASLVHVFYEATSNKGKYSMNQLTHTSPFDGIRHKDERGKEYWSARELGKLLGYSSWQSFQNTLVKAREACGHNNQFALEHFYLQIDVIRTGNGSLRKTEAYRLSRYACYLIIQNADPHKPIVAVGQTYFAVQTRRQELTDQLAALPEEQKRLILRSEMAIFNSQLAEAARNAGVIQPLDFATFQDHGYSGLHGELKASDIHRRKGLKKGDEIIDYMGSEELGANIFRATQTDAKLRREQIKGKDKANRTHYQVGRKVRQTIKELGSTMPEDLPTPAESVQQLQRQEEKRLQERLQPSLFDEPQENADEASK